MGRYIVFLITLLINTIYCTETFKIISISTSYKKGVEAYWGEQWSECIAQFEESLHLYKLYRSKNINCRFKCDPVKTLPIVKDDIEDLIFYESVFARSSCLSKCQMQEFQDLQLNHEVVEPVILSIKSRKPYEYLHVCYFQMYALQKAASAVFTYLTVNPNDKTMINNLKYYTKQPEVEINEIVDLEIENFAASYQMGVRTYRDKQWASTVAHMEEALQDYFAWENSCRADCEQQPQQDSSSEFLFTISNSIASLLYCRQQCQSGLKDKLNFKSGFDFLAEILNYLQISYYHLEDYKNTANTVASYLLLMPKNEDMLENRKIYSTLTSQEDFYARPDLVYYYKRDMYEKKLLSFYFDENDKYE